MSDIRNITNVIEGIDWKLLDEQRLFGLLTAISLIKRARGRNSKIAQHLEGIMNLLDSLTDAAIEDNIHTPEPGDDENES